VNTFRQINSPVALAAFGAFFVPEPLGMCLVLAAAIWWLTQVVSLIHARLVDGVPAEFENLPIEVAITKVRRCAAFFRSRVRPIGLHNPGQE
jgi:hypothetical protein